MGALFGSVTRPLAYGQGGEDRFVTRGRGAIVDAVVVFEHGQVCACLGLAQFYKPALLAIELCEQLVQKEHALAYCVCS